MLTDDGDIPRAVGYVTIYSAYLEERIDDLLFKLDPLEKYEAQERKWPISRKLKKCENILKSVDHDVAREILSDLELCKDQFEWRNKIIHGRIYAPEYHAENLKSGRTNVPDIKATSEEIYTLANNLDEL
ncbi:MAG: hypothetical protein OEZ58_17840, partial [Gammaproteobacteria bacterium]|nr:hypothetical protein [Gammaproteobacteria bacterium]